MSCFVVILMCIFVLGVKEAHSKMCYKCDMDECKTGLGLEVDCGDGHCGMYITTVRDKETEKLSFVFEYRFCTKQFEGGLEDTVCLGGSGGESDPNGESEICYCDSDFCNAKAPECSKRELDMPMIREALAEECKEEIKKIN